jgi:import inner membrane translocase subunit TIM17
MIALRKKEDSWNQIIAGAVTGGLLAFRSGARVAFKNAIFGGMMLGSIVVVEKIMMKMHKKEELQMQKEFYEKQNR